MRKVWSVKAQSKTGALLGWFNAVPGGHGPRKGVDVRRGAGNQDIHISSVICPTAAYYLLESVIWSSEESVSAGAVPDAALTGRASLTSAVTSAMTRCGSL